MPFLPLDHITAEHEYASGSWQDFTGDLTTASVVLRELEGKHTASLSFYNATMDPAQGTGTRIVKKGDRVRVWMDNDAGTPVRRKTATFKVKRVSTAIDLTKPPGRQYLVTLQLHGAGHVSLSGKAQHSGVDTIDELSNTLTTPYEIGGDGFGSGRTTPSGTYTEVAVTETASELDQVLTTRDGTPGVIAFEDPNGTIQVFDSATQRTGAATRTWGPDRYSKIDLQFDMTHIINVLHVKFLEKIKTGAKHTRKVELDQHFEDSASVAKYGPFKKTVTIHVKGLGRPVDFQPYADDLFARNADPDPVPRSITMPIRNASELLPGYEDGHYVGSKVTIVHPDGVTTYTARISRIQHSITNRRWLVQVFLRNTEVVQQHRARARSTEVAHTPDGMVLTAHLDDAAVDDTKLADGAVVTGKLASAIDATGTTITGPSVKTAASGARIEFGISGGREKIYLYSGNVNETTPGELSSGLSGQVQLTSPGLSGSGTNRASIALTTATNSTMFLTASGGVSVSDGLYAGSITAAAGLTVNSGGVTVSGGGLTLTGDVTASGATLQVNTSLGAVRITGASNIAGKVSTSYASATGASLAFVGNTAVIGVQSYNASSPSASNTQTLHALDIHSWSGGLIMEDLSGGGSTGASIGNGGRVVRTTSSRRYKYAVKPAQLEDSRAVVAAAAAAAATFKRKKLHPRDPADHRRYGGMIAENLAREPYAEPFLIRDRKGRPDGIHYAELVAPLAQVTADHETRLRAVEARLEQLEQLGSGT
jgi:hypothetical protein